MMRRHVVIVLLAGLAIACGGVSRPAPEPWLLSVEDLGLPPVERLGAWLDEEPSDPADRLLRSFVLEAAGDIDAAVGVLLDSSGAWSDELETARALRVGAMRHTAPAFEQWVSRVAPVRASDQALGPTSRLLWGDLAVLAAYREHRYAMAPGVLDRGALGSPTTWASVGPLSSFDALDLDRTFPAAAGPALPDEVDRGAGSVSRLVEAATASGTSIPYTTNGIYLAETFLTVEGEGTIDVLASCAAPFVATIDGAEFARRNVDDTLANQVRFARIRLAPGSHRILVKVGLSAETPLVLQVAPSAGLTITGFDAEAVSWNADGARVLEADRALRSGHDEPYAADGLAWLSAVDAAIGSGDGVWAGELLDQAAPVASLHPVVAYHLARLTDVAFEHSPNDRAERALGAAAAASVGWPGAVSARLRVAAHHREEGQWDSAWRELEPLLLAHPDLFAVQAEAAQLAGARGWGALRRKALQQAVAAFPRHCPTVGDLLDDRLANGETITPDDVPADWLTCDRTWRRLAVEYHLASGDVAAARDIIDLLRTRNPSSRSYAVLYADLARASGNSDAARRALTEYEEWTGDSGTVLAWLADTALAEGDADEAGRRMSELREAWPAELGDLLTEAFVFGNSVFGDARRDAVDIVRDYVADDPDYEAPVVYVWDFARTRWFDDGSALDYVHQVVQVRTRDALGEYGEVGVPSGAVLLSARTIKPDGRAHVPEFIAGKDSISMPDLERGDFIDLEWVAPSWGPTVDRPAVRSNRFFFRSFEGPFHDTVSEYVAPESWGEPQVDLRGEEPEYTREIGDGLQRIRVSMHGSLPPAPDARSVNAAEWIPSIRVAWEYDWDLARRMYANTLVPLVTPTDAIRRGVDRLLVGARDDRERIHRLYRFVSDEITDFGGFFSIPATWTWESGEGERTPLLLTMLTVAGFEPDLVFVRPWDQDHTPTSIPDASVYDLNAVRVPVRGGDVWLEPDFGQYPFDYLRIDAQGCEGLVVWGPNAGEMVTTPRWPDDVERNDMRMEAYVGTDGAAAVVVTETIPLRTAWSFRLYAESAEDERLLTQQLESALASTFPSVGPIDIDIEGLDDPDGPIQIRYEFESFGFATASGGTLTFDGELFSRPLANWYGERETRDRPMLVGMPVLEHLEAVFHAPADWTIVEVPDDASASEDGTSWARDWGVRDGEATLVRDITMPIRRVAPDDYPALAEVLGELQAGDRMRVVMAPVR